jgi:hypothetical protein
VKDFEHRIEPAFFDLITVAFVARLNQLFHNAKALADDTLPFRELRQLRPKGNFRRKFGN